MRKVAANRHAFRRRSSLEILRSREMMTSHSSRERAMQRLLCLIFVAAVVGCGHHPGNGNGDGNPGGGSDSGSASCGLVTCASANAMCGPIGDGCGGVVDC